MKIISHRGFWQNKNEKNQRIAFERSVEMSFGIETDVRDSHGTLVISHDIPSGNDITLIEFLDIVGDSSIPLAMNIKSDGLVSHVKAAMEKKKIQNWFAFDMSIPDMRGYVQHNLPIFTRVSELEKIPILLNESIGIWLDEFHSTWYSPDNINQFLSNGKYVCIVSPELHGRNHIQTWHMLKSLSLHPNLMLCTDFPDKAQDFFGGTND